MIYCTKIEIDGISTDVVIEYENRFGELKIVGMADMDGNEIAPDLLDEKLSNEINSRLLAEVM
jgi:hypothetical protein